MNINQNTQNILKNFSEINTNILIKPGKELNTISTMRNIFAKASIDETFDTEFGIYDLNEFLAVLSGMKNPVITFKDKLMKIVPEGRDKGTRYFYSDPSVVQSPSKTITMPSEEITFELNSNSLSEMKRAASVIGAPDMVLEKLNGSSSLVAKDKKNDTANNYSSDIITKGDGEFKFFFKVENLKLMDGSYDVSISSKNISNFKSKNSQVEYWIALEPESTYSA